jgi:DNA-binding Lrp family transcriptional regulator
MNELDWKDKKILRELDINSRQSLSNISKKTKISKQVINYRIKNLINKKIIKNFITYIDTQKIGHTFYDIFFKLKYSSQEEEKRIINEITKLPEVGWFISCSGEWGMGICVMAKDPSEFKSILEKILKILENKVLAYDFFIVLNASQLPYKELYSSKPYPLHTFLGEKEKINLNPSDFKVLKLLSDNSRLSRRVIAKKSSLSLEKIRYSMKKLERLGVIQAYKPLIDMGKIGYIWSIMLFQPCYVNKKRKEEFLNYLKRIPQTFYFVEGVGNWSIMVEFYTKSLSELEELKKDISIRFDDVIGDERTLQIKKEHKCTFFPHQIIV